MPSLCSCAWVATLSIMRLAIALLIGSMSIGCTADDGNADTSGSATAASTAEGEESGGSGPGTDAGMGTTVAGDGPADSSGGGGGLSQTAACAAYLACATVATPAELGSLLEAYGPEGTCWASTPEVAAQCDMACMAGLEQLQEGFGDEPECGGNGSPATDTGMVDDGMQPADGMYSDCVDASACIGLGTCITFLDALNMPMDGFCTNIGCTDPSTDCDPSPGGTALPLCVMIDLAGNPDAVCALDCSGGATCPGGMTCRELDQTSVCF
jgi:hypothetical protein